MDVRNQIRGMLNELKQKRQRFNNELRRMPRGTLVISSNGSRVSYFRRNVGPETSRLRGIGP